MSYDKNTWETGDTITAQKLNHMEDGIAGGGGVLIANKSIEDTTITLDKTWQQIYDSTYTITLLSDEGEKDFYPITCAYVSDGTYYVESADSITYTTDSADGYPQGSM